MRLLMVVMFIGIICPLSTHAQNETPKSSVQINYGLVRTLHYNQPIALHACFEGCYPLQQKAKRSFSTSINYYDKINNKNEIELGVGVMQYKFQERGIASDGGGNWNPYEGDVQFYYFDFSVGHRYLFRSSKTIKPFVENQIIYQLLAVDQRLLRSGGLAMAIAIGFLLPLNDSAYVNLNGFFKSGLTRYSIEDTQRYVPYCYGLTMGLGFATSRSNFE